MKPRIYLAGPITGATGAEANNWRGDMTARLARHGIVGISPLRAQPQIGERYDMHYPDPCFGAPAAIVGKNFLDLRTCNMTLAYFPRPAAAEQALVEAIEGVESEGWDAKELRRVRALRSIGTVGEVSWCYALQKPCAIVSDDPLVREHPFMTVQANWMLSTLDEAERLIVGLYADYAK
jgi:hypothetical protein